MGRIAAWSRRGNARRPLPAVQHRAVAAHPFDVVVAAFYCLEALHGERRDRSLLFWSRCRSPDRTAVLAKLTIPLW
jgi:hypothetical protein